MPQQIKNSRDVVVIDSNSDVCNARNPCAVCRCPSEFRIGLQEIIRSRLNGLVPFLAFLIVGIGGFVLYLGWESVHPRLMRICGFDTSETASRTLDLLGIFLCLAIPIFVFKTFPIRVLVCPRCKMIRKYGIGRDIPIAWQESIAPNSRCTRCGYSLSGLTEARCPECGRPFPVYWISSVAH